MPHYAIAMDLGTSGLRAQVIDLETGAILSTALTTHHPLPGANVMDHLHFALEMGVETAQAIMLAAINQVIGQLRIDTARVIRCALCGNPIQLSLFQGIEIRDLAYAGQRKLQALGVVPPARAGEVCAARDLPGLALASTCEVIIPPSVRHAIGADALAMLIQTGMLANEETALVTDYGTNAEMALLHNGRVFTGSTAAGPALEGQHITCGMLAVPGVIADLLPEPPYHRAIVLNAEMLPEPGSLIDLKHSRVIDAAPLEPIGITGTGTIALLNQALENNLVAIPRITTADAELHLSDTLYFTETDLLEAGKAIGAVRAGHLTLCREAGISLEQIQTAYLSGASGTYVDALKAQRVGLIPPHVRTICQVGNTSLAMARDLARDPDQLEMMRALASTLQATHCVLASSKTFQNVYILELSYWTEGMPMAQYRRFLKKYGLPDLLPVTSVPEVIHTVQRDIADLGRFGLTTLTEIGLVSRVSLDACDACRKCVDACPAQALTLVDATRPVTFALTQSRCNGVACRRCERACPENVFTLNRFFGTTTN